MKLPLRWFSILIVLALISWGIHIYREASFKVYVWSPARQIKVCGLPFKGVAAHPLDGCLRVYLYDQSNELEQNVWQTTIKWGTDLKAEWHSHEHGSFSILKDGQEIIKWQIQDAEARCINGSDLITYDPHELWMRTGSALPSQQATK